MKFAMWWCLLLLNLWVKVIFAGRRLLVTPSKRTKLLVRLRPIRQVLLLLWLYLTFFFFHKRLRFQFTLRLPVLLKSCSLRMAQQFSREMLSWRSGSVPPVVPRNQKLPRPKLQRRRLLHLRQHQHPTLLKLPLPSLSKSRRHQWLRSRRKSSRSLHQSPMKLPVALVFQRIDVKRELR